MKTLKNKIKAYVQAKVTQFLNSRFLLGITMLSIGISGTVIYYEAPQAFKQQIVTYANIASDAVAEASDSPVGEADEDDSEILMAEVSAYTSRVEETDGSPYITADGTNLKEVYECVVASNDYEFDTRLAIEQLGVCRVADRMNKRYTGKGNIDVYMGNDLVRAREFGRRTLSYIVIQ